MANRCAVERALAALPAQQRQVVWATKALGHTQSEVAELTGRKPGTVAVHTSRAVRVLRMSLAALTVVGLTLLCATVASWWRYVTPVGQPGTPAPPLEGSWTDWLSMSVLAKALWLAMLCAIGPLCITGWRRLNKARRLAAPLIRPAGPIRKGLVRNWRQTPKPSPEPTARRRVMADR
ncbi:RNA polymerase sigma factor [Streptomyces sp. LHD-70]|uniref:RNA polymerase sigma factor n=1 Tax=Streptomyces sp. LHD-70 TaxID=3072140 RepID=UPI0035BE228D